MFGLVVLMLAADGGAMTPYDGHLEAGVTYVVTGEDLAKEFIPPRLVLPYHHAGRVEWLEPLVLPRGRVKLVFKVESHDVQRMMERRWNSTWRCRVVSVEPAK